MDQQSIQALIELVNNSNIGEVKLEQGNFKLTIRHKDYHPKGTVAVAAPVASAPVLAAAPQVAAPTAVEKKEESAPVAETIDESKYFTLRSPMIGTFYRSSSPDKEPFVKVGDRVEKGDTLCIIEAMKLFNEIEAETSGVIVKVFVDNTSPIEYDQPLFLIDPS